MKKILALIFLICINLNAQDESLYFDVIHNKEILGSLEATKTVDNGKIIYKSHTQVVYHLLTTINIDYNYEVIYSNNHLEKATVLIKVKDHVKTNVQTVQEGNVYHYYSDQEIIKTIQETIPHSIEQLLFEEPIGISKIYAEEHGEFHTLELIDKHTYLKTAPNGNKNTYQYVDGKLYKSEIDAGIIKFSIIKKTK